MSCVIHHKNPWFDVREKNKFFYIQPNEDQVAILPIVADSGIVMVKAKRPLLNDAMWELPGGGISKNETPKEAAQRELREETGISLRISDFSPMLSAIPCPNRMPTIPYLFYAYLTQSQFDNRLPHDQEIDSLALFPFRQLAKMVMEGELKVSLSALFVSRFLLAKTAFSADSHVNSGVSKDE